MANFSQTLEFNGLGTIDQVVTEDGNYYVESKSTIPTISTGSTPSALVTVIKQNGSTLFTSDAGQNGAYLNNIICAAGDTLSVTYSSTAAVDKVLNAVKSAIIVGSNQ